MSPTSPPTSLPPGGIIGLEATQMAEAIRERHVSCREIMVAHLAWIAQVNGRVNAIVSLRDRDELLVEADAADAELQRGLWRGPMHGMPHAVKDLAPTRGLRTTFGSPIFAVHVPREDALFVERLRKAGAIFVGKTNVSEFGLGSHSYNPVWGTTLNAYDPNLSAGGSSGGAAVATAYAWCRWPMAVTLLGPCAIPPAGMASSASAPQQAEFRRCPGRRAISSNSPPMAPWRELSLTSPSCFRS